MLWYVNPKNSRQAVNLATIKSIELVNMSDSGPWPAIRFEDYSWVFPKKEVAEQVYEALIRFAQESRVRGCQG